jgi:hypothetical protein
MLQARRSRVGFPTTSYCPSSSTVAPGQTPPGVKCSRRVSLTISPPSLSRSSRKCGCLDFSELSGPPRPITGIYIHVHIYIYLLIFLEASWYATKLIGNKHDTAFSCVQKKSDMCRTIGTLLRDSTRFICAIVRNRQLNIHFCRTSLFRHLLLVLLAGTFAGCRRVVGFGYFKVFCFFWNWLVFDTIT